MTTHLATLRRLVSMLETMRPAAPGYLSFWTDAGKYEIGLPDVWTPGAPWTWRHEDADADSIPARHGTAKTLYGALDEVMGNIDWATCHQCRRTHEVEGNGEFCADCLADMGEAQADAEADAADNRLATIREAGL